MAAQPLASTARADAQQSPQQRSSAVRAAGGTRVNSLDGVRTFAVLAVMMVHAGMPWCELGWVGVDVFFVLSGFLITTLLCAEHREHGRISLPKFWARRFLRLMPAYWVYVGTLTALILLSPERLQAHGGWSPATYVASLWAYFVNYLPMGGIWSKQELSLHLWSLAVEEQFYFLWPPLIFMAFHLKRPWMLAWGLVLLILSRRFFLSVDEAGGLPTLDVRGIGIILGCAVAMTLALAGRPRWILSTTLRSALILATALTLIVLTALLHRGDLNEHLIKARVLPWLCAAFVAATAMLWYGPADRLTAFLASRPMAYLGRISYGLYLYHQAARLLVWDVLLPGHETWNKYLRYGVRSTVYVGLTVVIAAISYELIEKRFLRLKDRFR